jgi:CRISPR-associated endonuclease/helicase Cas3
VDQTFLSVLQTNHFFVRLFALGRKTVIFDEVHAYDTYMTEIFQTLLRWLRVMGSSVIILSATLPVATRRKLVEAYGGDTSKASDAEASSIVTWVSDKTTDQKSLPLVERSPVRVEWIEHSPETIAQQLRDEMCKGGCVAVVCNRVARAQEVYRAVKKVFRNDARFVPGDNLRLFHARFPMVWRDEIEKRVLKQANKDSERELPFIVVATQVIEQSLDLDFDLMITDLPPMDLLIQRVGRLHRHKEHDGLRPDVMKTPRVLITKPEKEYEVPRFGKDEYVYSYYVLLRTWLELKSRERDDTLVLKLPKQTRELIEAVYTGDKDHKPDFLQFKPEQQEGLDTAWQSMLDEDARDRSSARDKVIFDPGVNLIKRRFFNFPEEDEQVQQSLKSLTRKQTLPSVTVVCLFELPRGAALEEDDEEVVAFSDKRPDNTLTTKLIRRSVQLSGWKLFKHFINIEPEPSWQERSVLRNCRIAKFSKRGETWDYPLGNGEVLELSREYGIILRENADSQDED